MIVYVFGNPDLPEDALAFTLSHRLHLDFPNVQFVPVQPNADLPFADNSPAIIMDVVLGLNQVTLLDNSHLSKLSLSKSSTAHDYDLGFQLKYLHKLGLLGPITIIGLPASSKIDYSLIHSIFKKLVVQDMQGS